MTMFTVEKTTQCFATICMWHIQECSFQHSSTLQKGREKGAGLESPWYLRNPSSSSSLLRFVPAGINNSKAARSKKMDSKDNSIGEVGVQLPSTASLYRLLMNRWWKWKEQEEKRTWLLDDLRKRRKCWKLKEEAEDRNQLNIRKTGRLTWLTSVDIAGPERTLWKDQI